MLFIYRRGIYIELALGVITLGLIIASHTRLAILCLVLVLALNILIRYKADKRALNEKENYDSSIKKFTHLEEQVSVLQTERTSLMNNFSIFQNETGPKLESLRSDIDVLYEKASLMDDFSIFQNETSPKLESLRSDFDVLYQELPPLKSSLATSEVISQNIQQLFRLLEDQSQEIQLLQTKDDSLKELSDQLYELFHTITNSKITPVQNSKESYDCFIKTLESCEQSLIIVSPWIREKVLNYKNPKDSKTIKDLLINNLENDRVIHFGWGHWKNTFAYKGHYLPKTKRGTPRETFFRAVKRDPDNSSNMYDGFKWLESLEKEYPSKFKLKFLGTHEKYVICDQKSAMLGSHNFMTSTPNITDWELGIETTDQLIINTLTSRFMAQRNLENPV